MSYIDYIDSALAGVGGLTNLGRWLEGAGVRPCPTRATPVALEGDEPGPLASWAGPDLARWPAPGRAALPPLALGGAGGHALRAVHTLAFKVERPSEFMANSCGES